MKLPKFIKSWSVSISIILVVIAWYLLMQFIVTSIEARMVSIFWYSYFIALGIWAIIARIISKNERQIKAYLIMNYAGGRPFEYLFFTFLFISTGCLTFLVTFLRDITDILLNNALYVFTLVFFYSGAIVFGWFQYMKRIEG
ncbi:MAG: hypothetical protein KAH91_01815 [Thermoplasmatales archaeon]|nr:hypothetical protein [Thermoplasmatales archaeon]MCK5636129.1 hypothetical protein [Thermoplasmatales archaeon]